MLISGYSKLLEVGPYNSYVVIKGPNAAYVLPRDGETSEYNIGKCAITEHYRINDTEHPDKTEEICVGNAEGSCTFIDDNHGNTTCKSCSLIDERRGCITSNKYSSCGWGEVRDICESIGNIGECNDMYVEGCSWNKNKQMCTQNPIKDKDGDPSRKSEGCMKCDDIQHAHTCNSLSNCFYNKKQTGSNKGKGICQACSSIKSVLDKGATTVSAKSRQDAADKCMNYDITGGQCQWRTDVSEPHGESRCRDAHLYPFIYEWIWYNRIYLLSLFGCMFILFKFPIDSIPWPARIIGYIVKIILMVVTIPALSVLIVRADGEEGRKQYIDASFDAANPGISNLIYDQNRRGAKWPAVFYDGEWDNFIMDDNSLRKLAEMELGPKDLDWSKSVIWDSVSKWNDLVNSLGDNIITLISVMSIISMIVAYAIGKVSGGNVKPSTTAYIVIGGILAALYIRHLIKGRKKYIRDRIDPIYKEAPYKGQTRELKSPEEKGESKDSILNS